MNTMFGPLEEAQPIKKATGIEMITEERQRQITVKGYDAEHDEDETAMQLSCAAAMFIAESVNKDWKNNSHYDDMGNGARFQLRGMDNRKWKENWPWDDHDGRKSSSMLSCLVKAGALIAAEIDRLNEI